jgi:hypothetical protein
MGFFNRLFKHSRPSGTFQTFSVKCARCGETIQGHVNVNNEPSLEVDSKGKTYFTCRKVLIGNSRCFQQIEVFFIYDEGRCVLERKINGGEFVED